MGPNYNQPYGLVRKKQMHGDTGLIYRLFLIPKMELEEDTINWLDLWKSLNVVIA